MLGTCWVMVLEVYCLLISLSITKLVWLSLTWASPGIWYDHHLESNMTFTCWDLTWPSPAGISFDLRLGSDITLICWDLTWLLPGIWPSPAGIWNDLHLQGFNMTFTWDLTSTWWDLTLRSPGISYLPKNGLTYDN